MIAAFSALAQPRPVPPSRPSHSMAARRQALLDRVEDLHPRDLAAVVELAEFLGDAAAGTKAGEVS
jgi:hypothetical protein